MLAREFFDQLLALEGELNNLKEHVTMLEERLDAMPASIVGGAHDNLNASWRILDAIEAVTAARHRWGQALDAIIEREDEALEVIGALQAPTAITTYLWQRCLYQRYILARTYHDIAEEVGKSEKAVSYAISCALDAVDAQGLVAHL